MSLRRVMGVLLAGAMLSACGGLRSNAEADRTYVLRAEEGAAQATPVAGVLMVPRPGVQPGLDTDRIALTREGNELDYFALSRWSGPLPQVLGAFAVQSMHGAFTTVTGVGRNAGQAEYELLLTARHFEAAYGAGGAPEVRVAFECLLVHASPRRVLGSCDADVREPAGENRMAAIVAAFERATRQALAEVRRQAAAAARTN